VLTTELTRWYRIFTNVRKSGSSIQTAALPKFSKVYYFLLCVAIHMLLAKTKIIFKVHSTCFNFSIICGLQAAKWTSLNSKLLWHQKWKKKFSPLVLRISSMDCKSCSPDLQFYWPFFNEYKVNLSLACWEISFIVDWFSQICNKIDNFFLASS